MADDATTKIGRTERERLISLEQWRRGVDTELIRGNDMMHEMKKEIIEHGKRLERIDAKATLAVAVISFVAVAVIGCGVTLIFKQSDPTPITVELVMPK